MCLYGGVERPWLTVEPDFEVGSRSPARGFATTLDGGRPSTAVVAVDDAVDPLQSDSTFRWPRILEMPSAREALSWHRCDLHEVVASHAT